MKKLFLLLAICCAAVACEKFEIPDIEIDREITRSSMNGYYQQVSHQFLKYEDGKAVELKLVPDSPPWPISDTRYFVLDDMFATPYLSTKFENITQAFINDRHSSPVDLQALKMTSGWNSYMSDIHKLTNDTLILLEPVSEAIKRCKDDKNYTRSYNVYVRVSPSKDLLESFDNAMPMSEYGSFWDNIFKKN